MPKQSHTRSKQKSKKFTRNFDGPSKDYIIAGAFADLGRPIKRPSYDINIATRIATQYDEEI